MLVDKFEEWLTVNVLLELDADGDEDIRTQLLKLSEETWSVPEQEVFDELVVIDVVSITLEKVSAMGVFKSTVLAESAGDV